MPCQSYEWSMMHLSLVCRGSARRLCIPETICDATKAQVPGIIAAFGGHGVVKVSVHVPLARQG